MSHCPRTQGVWDVAIGEAAGAAAGTVLAGDWGRLARGGGGNFKFSSKDALIQGHNDGFGVEL